jgi:hypothetical protein
VAAAIYFFSEPLYLQSLCGGLFVHHWALLVVIDEPFVGWLLYFEVGLGVYINIKQVALPIINFKQIFALHRLREVLGWHRLEHPIKSKFQILVSLAYRGLD